MKFLQALPKAKYTGRVLQLSDYTASLAPTPAKVYWEFKVPAGEWGMLGNDTVADCEIARIAHMLMNVTAHTGTMVVPTLAEVLAAYSAISGYDPSQTQPDGSNPTDVGCNTEDVLNYWQNTGIAGHKIAGWVQCASSQEAIQQAIWLFGAAAIDIAIYQSMMDQFNAEQPWDNPSGAMDGYHAVPAMGFGRDGLTVVTWGALEQMGWDTALKVLQACYAVVTPEWIEQNGKTPSGFDLETLQADLAALES
jgi:hypothetical protein